MDNYYFPDLSNAEKLRLLLQMQNGEFTQHLIPKLSETINFRLKENYYPKVKDENNVIWMIVAIFEDEGEFAFTIAGEIWEGAYDFHNIFPEDYENEKWILLDD